MVIASASHIYKAGISHWSRPGWRATRLFASGDSFRRRERRSHAPPPPLSHSAIRSRLYISAMLRGGKATFETMRLLFDYDTA